MPAPKGHPPYNKNGEGGHPKVWTEEKIHALADSLEEWLINARKEKKGFWWHEWCWDNGIAPSRVTKLAIENERFGQVYAYTKEWQESIIVQLALTKKLSDGFSKFYLCNHYSQNWKNKDVDLENSNEKVLSALIIELEKSRNDIIKNDPTNSEAAQG